MGMDEFIQKRIWEKRQLQNSTFRRQGDEKDDEAGWLHNSTIRRQQWRLGWAAADKREEKK